MYRNYRYVKNYMGPLRAAIMDWSGTVADKYVVAPTVVFTEVFKKYKVPISFEEARLPMGLRKDLHIKEITEIPQVAARWEEAYGRAPDQSDVDNMFRDYVPMQLEVLHKYSTLLPGCAEAMQKLKTDYNMKIGSTTGFLRDMVDILLVGAKEQGYEPDATVAGDEVIHGARPKPFMIYRNMDLLDVHPIQSVVKVDDTVGGVDEALEAGCWGVGVAKYSNYMNIDDEAHEARLSAEEIAVRLEHSRNILIQSGAHYVIDSVIELPAVCADINQRLARGEKP